MAQTKFDATTEAVLKEIDEQTPENSIHRAYAASVREEDPIQEMDIEDVAREEDVEFTPENAEHIAESTISGQEAMFEAPAAAGGLRDDLDTRGIDYDENAPELDL